MLQSQYSWHWAWSSQYICSNGFTFLTTQVISRLMSETSSGSFCSNDSVLQSLMVGLPFGGVGESVADCSLGHSEWWDDNNAIQLEKMY